MKLDNTIAAVVTGGASGLGEGTARAIAATGAKVALFDLNAERGEEIAREIGGVFCQVDVTDDASVAAAFAKARAAHGQERLTVNCAGIATGQKTVSRKKDTAVEAGLTPFSSGKFKTAIEKPMPTRPCKMIFHAALRPSERSRVILMPSSRKPTRPRPSMRP